MAIISQYQVVIAGQLITAALWNGMELNIINNGLIPTGIEDYSTNDTQAQTQTDPYPASTLSKATTLAGEIAQIRYQLSQILGETYWYIDPDLSLDTLKNGALTLAGVKTFSAAPILSSLTATRVPYLDASSQFAVSAVTPTELGYLSGVTSAIQTQLAAKASKAGTTTNDNAAAGDVGEYISAAASNVDTPATNVIGDLASISLTAGDWDVSANVFFLKNTATWTKGYMGISTTPGNSTTGLTDGDTLLQGIWASSATTPDSVPISIAPVRKSLAATTTVYLKYSASFSAGIVKAHGRISARRIR